MIDMKLFSKSDAEISKQNLKIPFLKSRCGQRENLNAFFYIKKR